MTTPSPLAKSALRALADAPLEVEPPTQDDADAAITAIARELEAVRTRRQRRRVAATIGVLAMAAGVAIFFGVRARSAPVETAAAVESVSGTVLVVRGNEGSTIATGSSVAKGDRVVASATGAATLRLPKGTELHALDGADVLVAEQGASQIFDLRAGALRLHVKKLETGERFVVRTGDAEIEVRGTAFEVRVDPNQSCATVHTTTHVSVSEGTVVVRHAGQEARVTANESWPAGCVAQSISSSPSSTVALLPPSAASPSPGPQPTASPSVVATSVATPPAVFPKPAPIASSPIAGSELAEQNRIFAEAMAAKRQGNGAAALAALDRLIANYPRGPLAESASVERMRILAQTDPARGAEAARAYLARHPTGYARDEAKKLSAP